MAPVPGMLKVSVRHCVATVAGDPAPLTLTDPASSVNIASVAVLGPAIINVSMSMRS